MNIYSKKAYLTPIADLVIVDGNEELLDSGIVIQSKQVGTSGEEADAKPMGAVEFTNEIWDSEANSETE